MYWTVNFKKGALFCLAALLLLASPFAAARLSSSRSLPSSAPVQSRRLIVLDAGHGGVDPGAIGVNGAEEKAINLEITLTLRDILLANGWEVILTREGDISLNEPGITRISAIKTSDLKNRLKIINAAQDGIAVSVHQNKFNGQSSHGAQMFYGRKNPESEPLAASLQDAFREYLQPDNERQIKRSTSDVYIIHNAEIPTVLAECGFLSNPEECAQLCDPEYQKKAAFVLYCGIERFWTAREAARMENDVPGNGI